MIIFPLLSSLLCSFATLTKCMSLKDRLSGLVATQCKTVSNAILGAGSDQEPDPVATKGRSGKQRDLVSLKQNLRGLFFFQILVFICK